MYSFYTSLSHSRRITPGERKIYFIASANSLCYAGIELTQQQRQKNINLIRQNLTLLSGVVEVENLLPCRVIKVYKAKFYRSTNDFMRMTGVCRNRGGGELT